MCGVECSINLPAPLVVLERTRASTLELGLGLLVLRVRISVMGARARDII